MAIVRRINTVEAFFCVRNDMCFEQNTMQRNIIYSGLRRQWSRCCGGLDWCHNIGCDSLWLILFLKAQELNVIKTISGWKLTTPFLQCLDIICEKNECKLSTELDAALIHTRLPRYTSWKHWWKFQSAELLHYFKLDSIFHEKNKTKFHNNFP